MRVVQIGRSTLTVLSTDWPLECHAAAERTNDRSYHLSHLISADIVSPEPSGSGRAVSDPVRRSCDQSERSIGRAVLSDVS